MESTSITRRAPAAALCVVLCIAGGARAAEPTLLFENEAGVPPKEMASIERDFRDWAARVYAYHGVTPPPVTVRVTNKVPFGFYSEGTVLLPPNERWTMLDDFVHELTHHVTGHASSFFFKEGTSVHTLEALFAEEDRVPDTWPQFGQTTDAWVAVYRARGRLLPLSEALAWPHYRGDTPDSDFRSWQIYNLAGSFCGWYIRRYGYGAFQRAFRNERPEQDVGALEREWLAEIERRKPAPFDPSRVLPDRPRYREYARRLAQ